MSIAAKIIALFGDADLTTWNPLDKAAGLTLSGGDLTVTHTGANDDQSVRATLGKTSGKWHFEISAAAVSLGRPAVGVADATQSLTVAPGGANCAVGYANGTILVNSGSDHVPDLLPGTVAVEVDLDNMLIYFQAFGGSRTTGYDISYLTGPVYPLLDVFGIGESATGNFGASAFVVNRTSGFSPWQ